MKEKDLAKSATEKRLERRGLALRQNLLRRKHQKLAKGAAVDSEGKKGGSKG